FNAVMAALKTPKPAARPAVVIKSGDGVPIAKVTRKADGTAIQLNKTDQGFDDWLVEHLAEIHRDWQTSRGE
ncbi:MAG: plasmid partitioning protein RepB, partial [Paracoccaceae bacterium]